jgi:hypothetical protein
MCEIFCNAVDGLAIPLLFAAVSEKAREQPEVTMNMAKPLGNRPPWGSALIDGLDLVKFIVLRGQDSYRRTPIYDVGQKIQFFLDIYDRLEPILTEPFPGQRTQAKRASILAALFAREDIRELREFLLQAWIAVESLFKDQFVGISHLNRIGNPITRDHIIPMLRLLEWFCVLEDIPDEENF